MTSTTDETATQRTLRESISAVGLRRIVFSLVVVAFLGVFLFFGFGRDLVFLFTGWFEMGAEMFAEEYEAVPPHRVHIFVFALLLWTATLGMLAQLRSPQKHIAAQWMALLPWAGLLLALLLAGFLDPLPVIVIFGGLTLLATILHPAGRDLVRSFEVSRVNRVLLALVIVAAVPLLAFASIQLGLQTGAIEPAHDHAGAHHEHVHQEHVDHGHFAGTAAFGFLVIGVGLVASFRPTGWWLPAWVAGLLPVVFGMASIAFPESASAVGPVWAVLAVLWGFTFVVAAELTQDDEASTPLGRWQANRMGRIHD